MNASALTMEGQTVLVTGANRGLGQALVEEALRRGARRSMPERATRWHTRTSGSRRCLSTSQTRRRFNGLRSRSEHSTSSSTTPAWRCPTG